MESQFSDLAYQLIQYTAKLQAAEGVDHGSFTSSLAIMNEIREGLVTSEMIPKVLASLLIEMANHVARHSNRYADSNVSDHAQQFAKACLEVCRVSTDSQSFDESNHFRRFRACFARLRGFTRLRAEARIKLKVDCEQATKEVGSEVAEEVEIPKGFVTLCIQTFGEMRSSSLYCDTSVQQETSITITDLIEIIQEYVLGLWEKR